MARGLKAVIPGLGKMLKIRVDEHDPLLLQPHEIPFGDILDNAGLSLAASELNGSFKRNIGTNQLVIDSEAAVNETEASVGWFRYTLPHNYKAGGAIKIRVAIGIVLAGDAVLTSATVDFEARNQAVAGTVGSDLVTTAATAITTTFGTKDFVVTPTGLVAGDVLVCKIPTSVVEEAAGTGAANARITKLQILCDVQG